MRRPILRAVGTGVKRDRDRRPAAGPIERRAGGAGTPVTCPAASPGLTGDPVTVTIAADGQGVSFTCESDESGCKMTSTTALQPSAGEPVVAPRG